MEVRVIPSKSSQFPLNGILIKSADIRICLFEIQRMEIDLGHTKVFPLPGDMANSIWGCLVITHKAVPRELLGLNELCQFISPGLFIPEKTKLLPALSGNEIAEKFATDYQIFHPEFGWYEIGEPINWSEYIQLPEMETVTIVKPGNTVFSPKEIRFFRMVPLDVEEVLKNLENDIVPEQKKLPSDELTPWEKARLTFYKLIFGQGIESDDKTKAIRKKFSSDNSVKSKWMGIARKLFRIDEKRVKRMIEDFSNLEERNKSELEKFLNMLNKDPQEALKYALPINQEGTMRGSKESAWTLTKLFNSLDWNSFSSSGSGGGNVNLGNDELNKLTKSYRQSALAFIEQGKIDQAVFIYLKLLRDPYEAARVLKEAKRYSDAAALYVKHKMMTQAAECYELAKMYTEAIKIYKQQKMHEKAGDLYMIIGDEKSAMLEYEIIAQSYSDSGMYVKSAIFFKDKMKNRDKFRETLLRGWNRNVDALNCLDHYFSEIEDVNDLENELNTIHAKHVTEFNTTIYLNLLLRLYKKRKDISEVSRTMAYGIISKSSKKNPSLVNSLRSMQNQNSHITSDITSFLSTGEKWKG